MIESVLVYLFGVAFQFFPIRATRHRSAGEAIKDAVKADTLSLVAVEIGMFPGGAGRLPPIATASEGELYRFLVHDGDRDDLRVPDGPTRQMLC